MSVLSDVLAAFTDEAPAAVALVSAAPDEAPSIHADIQGGCCDRRELELPICPAELFLVLEQYGSLRDQRRGDILCRPLIGNDHPAKPIKIPPASILATPYRDPFAWVYVPTPMAPPRVGPPAYLIPATGEAPPPLVVTPLTEREMALDSKAVAAACMAWAEAHCTPWPFFWKANAQ